MKKLFVDTNIFLRFILKDNLRQAEKVKDLFKAAEGKKVVLKTNVLVIAEFAWTLKSFYKFSKKKICNRIKKILQLDFIQIDEKDSVLEAINIFEKKNVDFIDCLNFVFAKDRQLKIASFDRDFDKLDKRLRYKF